MIACPPPLNYADAMECVLPSVWNDQQDIAVFTNMQCHRAGYSYQQRAFVCTSRYTNRKTGAKRDYRFIVLTGGFVIKSEFRRLP